MASKSLGPFPKTYRFPDLVGGPADHVVHGLIGAYEGLTKDPQAVRAITFLVALVICSRAKDPVREMAERYGIEDVGTGLKGQLHRYAEEAHPAVRAAELTIRQVHQQVDSAALFEPDVWCPWRNFDGSAFCDLALLYFSNLNAQMFEEAGLGAQAVATAAKEFAIITRSFSARWFNACARYEAPAEGSIRWYLGHCLGKIDLELNRELSDWVEPEGNPWKRKRPNHNRSLL
ncbi:MAG: hypothetical protein ACAH95_01515 [Fimbriimonas sp.]|nr:hypothetical protein [Chthoniobacter sp.]